MLEKRKQSNTYSYCPFGVPPYCGPPECARFGNQSQAEQNHLSSSCPGAHYLGELDPENDQDVFMDFRFVSFGVCLGSFVSYSMGKAKKGLIVILFLYVYC